MKNRSYINAIILFAAFVAVSFLCFRVPYIGDYPDTYLVGFLFGHGRFVFYGLAYYLIIRSFLNGFKFQGLNLRFIQFMFLVLAFIGFLGFMTAIQYFINGSKASKFWESEMLQLIWQSSQNLWKSEMVNKLGEYTIIGNWGGGAVGGIVFGILSYLTVYGGTILAFIIMTIGLFLALPNSLSIVKNTYAKSKNKETKNRISIFADKSEFAKRHVVVSATSTPAASQDQTFVKEVDTKKQPKPETKPPVNEKTVSKKDNRNLEADYLKTSHSRKPHVAERVENEIKKESQKETKPEQIISDATPRNAKPAGMSAISTEQIEMMNAKRQRKQIKTTAVKKTEYVDFPQEELKKPTLNDQAVLKMSSEHKDTKQPVKLKTSKFIPDDTSKAKPEYTNKIAKSARLETAEASAEIILDKPALKNPRKVLDTPITSSNDRNQTEDVFDFEVHNYNKPPLELLNDYQGSIPDEQMHEKVKLQAVKLVNCLAKYEINAKVEAYTIGPRVIKLEVTVDEGTRISEVLRLENDIKMDLAVRQIRIEAPIPGKSAIGIELPNDKFAPVGLKQMLTNVKHEKGKLLWPLGLDTLNNVKTIDITKMPHLLIAGATGSGKSVAISSLITSLIMLNSPDDMRLILIDPKRVELQLFDQLPHLLVPIIFNSEEAKEMLGKAVKEMERRYTVFASKRVRNIESYNAAVTKSERLPFIVIVIDELADLMMTNKKEVEASIMRITQMARAAGIHLIVATQRPSVNVITGVIKANIPSRIAFTVSSQVDSQTILDEAGAERLLGKGDMLFRGGGEIDVTRLQGCYLSDQEIEAVTKAI